jgi:hypothetical protein
MKDKPLSDPRFQGMHKYSFRVESQAGKASEAHYVRDPVTGKLMDFKFKEHSEGI